MRLWFLRWDALIKMKQFDVVATELEKLNTKDLQGLDFSLFPELFPNRTGTMVSFDLLLLLALFPSHTGNHDESIHRLYCLIYPQKARDFKPDRIQHYRVLLHVISVLVGIPDIPLAIDLTKTVLSQFPESLEILSVLGKLELQVGDVDAAKATFETVF